MSDSDSPPKTKRHRLHRIVDDAADCSDSDGSEYDGSDLDQDDPDLVVSDGEVEYDTGAESEEAREQRRDRKARKEERAYKKWKKAHKKKKRHHSSSEESDEEEESHKKKRKRKHKKDGDKKKKKKKRRIHDSDDEDGVSLGSTGEKIAGHDGIVQLESDAEVGDARMSDAEEPPSTPKRQPEPRSKPSPKTTAKKRGKTKAEIAKEKNWAADQQNFPVGCHFMSQSHTYEVTFRGGDPPTLAIDGTKAFDVNGDSITPDHFSTVRDTETQEYLMFLLKKGVLPYRLPIAAAQKIEARCNTKSANVSRAKACNNLQRETMSVEADGSVIETVRAIIHPKWWDSMKPRDKTKSKSPVMNGHPHPKKAKTPARSESKILWRGDNALTHLTTLTTNLCQVPDDPSARVSQQKRIYEQYRPMFTWWGAFESYRQHHPEIGLRAALSRHCETYPGVLGQFVRDNMGLGDALVGFLIHQGPFVSADLSKIVKDSLKDYAALITNPNTFTTDIEYCVPRNDPPPPHPGRKMQEIPTDIDVDAMEAMLEAEED